VVINEEIVLRSYQRFG